MIIMRTIIIPVFTVSIFIAFTACKKSSPAKTPVIHNNSQLTVTVDPAIGAVMHSSSPDTFAIDLKDPSQWSKVPVVLHIDPSASCNTGTKVNDSTYLDTIDISNNKVAGVTVIAGNGTFTNYGLGFKYIFSDHSIVNGLGSNYVLDVHAQGNTICAATGAGLSFSTDGGRHFTNYKANGWTNGTIFGSYLQ